MTTDRARTAVRTAGGEGPDSLLCIGPDGEILGVHRKVTAGIDPALVRLAAGIEDTADLVADVRAAPDVAARAR